MRFRETEHRYFSSNLTNQMTDVLGMMDLNWTVLAKILYKQENNFMAENSRYDIIWGPKKYFLFLRDLSHKNW